MLTDAAVALGKPAAKVVAALWKLTAEVKFGKAEYGGAYGVEGWSRDVGKGAAEHVVCESDVVDGGEEVLLGDQDLFKKCEARQNQEQSSIVIPLPRGQTTFSRGKLRARRVHQRRPG